MASDGGKPPSNFYLQTLVGCRVFNSPVRVTGPEWLEPQTAEAVALIMDAAEELGQPLMLWETYRSQELQAAYFARGASQLAVVGVHHYGLAADLVKNCDGVPSWKGDFTFLGELAARFGLVWGGSWPHFRDCCHVQRISVADQPRLFAGEWYPQPDYKPATPA